MNDLVRYALTTDEPVCISWQWLMEKTREEVWPMDDKDNLPFMGEMMTCILCGKQQPSDPTVESNWRAIKTGETTYYACTDEFPPDGSSSESFSVAYRRFISKIMELRGV